MIAHRFAIVALVCFLAEDPPAKPKPEMPPTVKRYFEDSDRQRNEAIEIAESRLKARTADLKKLRNEKGAAKKIRDEITSIKRSIETLRKNDPPYVPAIYPKTLETGQVGRFIYPPECIYDGDPVVFEVLQVIEPGEMLVKGYGQTIWISDVSTKDMIDGRKIELGLIFEVVGTKAYPTVLGANKTVFRVRPVVMDPWLEKK